ncbi:uncharacterized protein LOC126260525, partial [Schistocerca nitens]|uniref:uncharacterized protein LOC126260525 n=1 Tax=Schistocerca nitens TaxID=7011 RepID=UPI002118368E
MDTKCVSCSRKVSSGVLCSCCDRWFHWGNCSGGGIGEANETLPFFCRLLLGSSHGRGVGQILQEKLGDRYQVTNFFKP